MSAPIWLHTTRRRRNPVDGLLAALMRFFALLGAFALGAFAAGIGQ